MSVHMRSQCRASGNKPDSSGNQRDAQPAQRTDLLVQNEPRHEGEQDIAERRGRQHIGEIGPGERVHVRCEKRKQQQNPHCDPRIAHGKNYARQVMERNTAGLFHPMREHGVAGRGENGHSSQHKILAKGHWKLRRRSGPNVSASLIRNRLLRALGAGSERVAAGPHTFCNSHKRRRPVPLRLSQARLPLPPGHAFSPTCCAPSAASGTFSLPYTVVCAQHR